MAVGDPAQRAPTTMASNEVVMAGTVIRAGAARIGELTYSAPAMSRDGTPSRTA
jgi:hypothetical protein